MPTPTQLKDFRVRAGGAAICEFIAEIPAEEIILELYLPIKDTETQQLANFFEKQLFLAKVNKKRFLDERPRQVREIVNWIKSGKRYRLFAAFSMYIARNLGELPRP